MAPEGPRSGAYLPVINRPALNGVELGDPAVVLREGKEKGND